MKPSFAKMLATCRWTMLYKTELSAPQPGLVLNWLFDEGCGATTADALGTHTATAYTTTAWAADVPTAPAPDGPLVPITSVRRPP